MARLFISHSSANNAEAAALNAWLGEQGWDDVFLDVTPDRGIAAGERWERALNEAASRCEAVLFLISRAWLGSGWCRKEYDLARRLNKRLFGALIEPIPIADLPPDITGTFQTLDLASGTDHVMIRAALPRTHEEVHVTFSKEGLARLKAGLAKAGLDPRFFRWPPESDPNRAPFRGLKPLEKEDAGIFFGREAPIVEGLDTLRGLAEAAAPRLLAILGASGAGKSSFLRAGLLPRLVRDDRTFLILPVIRPEGGALTGDTGLLPALEAALAQLRLSQSRASVRQAIAEGAAGVKPLLARLAAEAFRSTMTADGVAEPPRVLLAIDQAEELFGPDPENAGLLALVRDLVAADDPAVIVLFTIRSDSYDRLETAPALEGLRQRTLPLLPMPRGAYGSVIEGPAGRLAGTDRPLAIDPHLTQRLLQDIEKGGGSDALPLLAFTLGQLFLDYGGSGALKLADYEAFGGIRGAIEAAVRRAMAAADRDPRIPRDPDARFLLMRRGLIPWLAGIDPETGSPRRRLARVSDIPADAEPLVRLLVEQRLLSLDRSPVRPDGEEPDVTIEPAHEALLRQWGLLRGWLQEDFASLSVLDAVKRAARDWEANGRGADWLDHSGTRLAEAEAVAAREDLGRDLNPAARDYLAGCRARDDAEERLRRDRLEKERQLAESEVALARAEREAADGRAVAARRFTRLAVGATAAIGLFVILAGAMAVLSYLGAQERAAALAAAADARAAADAARWVAKSQGELRDGNPVEAVRSATRAFRDRPREDTRSALLTALLEIPNLRGTAKLPEGPPQAMAWLSDDALGFASSAAPIRTVGTGGPAGAAPWPAPAVPGLADGRVFVRALRRVGPDRTVAVLSTGTVQAWTRTAPAAVTLLEPRDGIVVDSAAIGPRGSLVAFAANGEGATAVSCEAGDGRDAARACAARGISDGAIRAVAVDENESRVALGDEAGGVTLIGRDGRPVGSPAALGSGAVVALSFSPVGAWLAAGTTGGEAVLIDAESGGIILRAPFSSRPVGALAFAPSGAAPDGTVAGAGATLALACGDASACLWRLGRDRNGAAEPHPAVRLHGHQGSATLVSWSPDGRRVAVGFTDGLLRVFEADTSSAVGGRLFPPRPTDLLRIASLPNAGGVVAGGTRGSAFVWTRPTEPPRILARDSDREIRALAPASDGRVATVLDDGTVTIWQAPAGRGSAADEAASPPKRWDAPAHPGLAWLDGGRLLAVALADGRIALHEPAAGRDTFLPPIRPGAEPWGLAASPDGTALFASYVDGTLSRWDVASRTSRPLRETAGLQPGEKGGPESLSVSPDGRWLAATADDESVRLFDTSGGAREALRTESPQTRTVAFSPDGKRLAGLGADGRVYLWTVAGSTFTRHLSVQPPTGVIGGGPARPTNWLAWAGPDTLALATPAGAIQLVPLDEAAWLRRAEGLELNVTSAPP